jgi:hypothetical protein
MAKRPKRPKRATPPPPLTMGDVFAVPLANGRFGACRVIDMPPPGAHFGDARYVAACAYIGDAPPPPIDHPDLRPLLVLSHHAYERMLPRKILGAWLSEPPPQEYTHLGNIPPSDADRAVPAHHYVAWHAISQGILAQWRWDHDRAAVLTEDATRAAELQQQRSEAERAKAAMTFASFRKQKLFADWTDYTPRKMTAAARKLMKETAAKLEALGPKPNRKSARAILRDCILAFNTLDEQNDHWIDSIERDDIVQAFDILARLAGFADEPDLADEWREF